LREPWPRAVATRALEGGPVVVGDDDIGVQRSRGLVTDHARRRSSPRTVARPSAGERHCRGLGLDLREHVGHRVRIAIIGRSLVREPARDAAHDPVEDREDVGVGRDRQHLEPQSLAFHEHMRELARACRA